MFKTRSRACLWFPISISLGLVILLVAQPVFATACNTGGCWGAYVEILKVNTDGRIWFVVSNPAALNAISPADGCAMATFHLGGSNFAPALFISPSDSERDQKYTMLLTAYTTGSQVSFGAAADPDLPGFCAVTSITMR